MTECSSRCTSRASSDDAPPIPHVPGLTEHMGTVQWSSPSVSTFFPISEFFNKLIRFLLHSSIVKSDNEIGKFSY